MVRYRHEFPRFRAFGWVVALPFSLVSCLAAAVIFDSKPAGAGVGAVVALVGIVIVMLGYSLAEVLGGYFPWLLIVAAVPIAALTWAVSHGWAWLWAAGWTVVVALLFGVSRGIMLHPGRPHGTLAGSIAKGFVPKR